MNLNELEVLAKAVYAPNKDDWELRQALLHFDRAATPENIICLIELVRQMGKALNRLYVSCPTSLECHIFHHSNRDKHNYKEECGPRQEYLAAISKAADALAKYKELTK